MNIKTLGKNTVGAGLNLVRQAETFHNILDQQHAQMSNQNLILADELERKAGDLMRIARELRGSAGSGKKRECVDVYCPKTGRNLSRRAKQ